MISVINLISERFSIPLTSFKITFVSGVFSVAGGSIEYQWIAPAFFNG
ncbi:MAG: hypothetical protein PUH03_03745 [bacterium]|nr:hypothetical protein [bacterium]